MGAFLGVVRFASHICFLAGWKIGAGRFVCLTVFLLDLGMGLHS